MYGVAVALLSKPTHPPPHNMHFTTIIPSAAFFFLLLQGVAGRDFAVSKAHVDVIDDDRIKQRVVGSSEATLTVSGSKENVPLSLTRERSLVDPQIYYYNNDTSTLVSPTAPPTSMPTHPSLKYVGNDWNWGTHRLGECEGDCDRNGDCVGDLICFQREPGDEYTHTPGCLGGDVDGSETDYCIQPDATIITAPPTTVSPTVSSMPTSAPTPMPTKNPSVLLDYRKVDRDKDLNECEGDCDRDVSDLVMFYLFLFMSNLCI